MATLTQSEMAFGGRDVAPRETSACDRLTEQIRSLTTTAPRSTQQITADSRPQTLEDALRESAITIRYNGKWFIEEDLAALIKAALNAASSSSVSAELNATVNLVEVIITYSVLPPCSLPQTTRFLAQTYYNANRAHKTRKLAEFAWTTLKHILESHLGGQCVVALMEIVNCRDDVYLESKIGYAVVAGALMIISEKMVLKEEGHRTFPIPGLTELLDSLWGTAVNGNDNLRELIMEIVVTVLSDAKAVRELDAQSSWEVLLETVEPCVAMTPNCKAALALVHCLTAVTTHFEARLWPNIAGLLVDVDRPLPEFLSIALLEPWLRLTPSKEWPRGLDNLIKKLSSSTRYIREIRTLVDWTVQIFENTEPRRPLPEFAKELEHYLNMPGAKKVATAEFTKGVVKMFIYSARSHSPVSKSERNELFKAICSVASRCVDATKFIFQIRADVENKTYFERPLQQQVTDETQSRPTMLYDLSDLPLDSWYAAIASAFKTPALEDWEAYLYFLDHLPSLLGNHSMFERRDKFITTLGQTVCDMLERGAYPEPPQAMELTKSQVTVRLIRIVTACLSYHRILTKQENVSLASTILGVAGSRDYIVSIPCIHALTICCYELPDLMSSFMNDVIDKMSKMVTQRYLAIHVLLFLAGLSRLPELFRNFKTHDYKKIFGVCGSYLQSIRGSSVLERQQTPSSDHSSSRTNDETVDALPQYVYALAHHVIAFWYLALKPDHRRGLKEFITSFLRYTSTDGRDVLEDQGLVTLDFIDRVDAEDTHLCENQELEHDEMDGRLVTRQRVAGVLFITTETALRNSKTIITVRRPTGTTKHIIPHSENCESGEKMTISLTKDTNDNDFVNIVPDDWNGKTYGRFYVPSFTSPLGSYDILTLPEDNDAVTRAIQGFDRTSALDSHKAGVIYIGEDQKTEDEIFMNVQGSPDYVELVEELGSLRRLKDATFNTQGLDRGDDADGQHAVVWNNDVTELVFHITTLMPNNEHVALNTANKKRHIGNDFVNIIFNNSGSPFDLNTFPSQFSAVYIVITPSARTTFLQTRLATSQANKKDRFYRVNVLTRPGYPAISSAAVEKVISGASLPGYVRNLALNDCVFSQMWSQSLQAGEYASSWRSRLEQIRRLRDRFS